MSIELLLALALYQGDLSKLSDCEPQRRTETITQTQRRLTLRQGRLNEVTMRVHLSAVEGEDAVLTERGIATGVESSTQGDALRLVRVQDKERGWVCVLQSP